MSNTLRKVHNANATPNVRIKFCVILEKKKTGMGHFLI